MCGGCQAQGPAGALCPGRTLLNTASGGNRGETPRGGGFLEASEARAVGAQGRNEEAEDSIIKWDIFPFCD